MIETVILIALAIVYFIGCINGIKDEKIKNN